MRFSRWDRDVRKAMVGRQNFQVSHAATLVMTALWDYAEDELARRAVEMSAEDLQTIQRIEATYQDTSYPLPFEGQRISNNHVVAFAAVAYFEGRLRPLARTRRRPQKDRPAWVSHHPLDAKNGHSVGPTA